MTTHVTLKIEFDSLLDAALVEEFIRDKELPCKIRVARNEDLTGAPPLIKPRRTRTTITPAMVREIVKQRGHLDCAHAAAHFGISKSSVARIYAGDHVLQKSGAAPK